MKKVNIIKAKIKQTKRIRRIENIFNRYNKLLSKVFLSVKVDWIDYKSPMVSFIKMKIKGKKLKKLQSACKNWKNKELKIFYLQKVKK